VTEFSRTLKRYRNIHGEKFGENGEKYVMREEKSGENGDFFCMDTKLM
jgi:hypothetical protein